VKAAGESMRGGRGVWWFAFLGVLVLVDVGLIAAAVSSTQPRAQAEAGPIPTFSQEPDESVATPSPSETPTPAASSPAVQSDDAPQVFLSAVSATEAWRATSGNCSGTPARVERTTDGGATWDVVTMPFELRTVVALNAGSERTSVYGGVGDSCALQYWSSFTGGEFWKEYPSDSTGVAYVDQAAVWLSDGSVPAPCESPTRVLSQGSNAVVVCPGILEARTGTGDWLAIDVPGLQDVAASEAGYVLAVGGDDGCDGIAVRSVTTPVTADSAPNPVGCAASAPAVEGVALSRSGETLWLHAGGKSFVSVDEGRTW